MRVPLSWLRQYCNPALSTEEIAERLNLTGSEVGRIERVGVGSPDGFVVGKVEIVAPHPSADRLTVCLVDDGSDELRTIVCGAPNVAAGPHELVSLICELSLCLAALTNTLCCVTPECSRYPFVFCQESRP